MAIKTDSHRILIGSTGWRHPRWGSDFYPDDLPADWRLTYYENEFTVTLIPAEESGAFTVREIEEWCDNSHAGFRFLIEVPASVCTSLALGNAGFTTFVHLLQPLAERIAALVFPCRPAEVEALLQNSHCELVRIFDLGANGANPELEQRCLAEGVGLCWHGEDRSPRFVPGLPALTRVSIPAGDLKRLRQLLEVILMASPGVSAAYLILEGNPPAIETLQQAKTLLELL